MKRLRKKYPELKIKFYQCGEYGENNKRPHYHACLFNLDFEDKTHWKTTNGIKLYVSDTLNSIWKLGFCSVGDVTFNSAAYVARYIVKKITGEEAEKHYKHISEITGEITSIIPEYTTMSRGGRNGKGLSYEWYKKYKKDVYPSDFIIINGKKVKPPKYYACIYEMEDEQNYLLVKKQAKRNANKHKEDNTPERLLVREKVKKAQIKSLKRTIEESTNET